MDKTRNIFSEDNMSANLLDIPIVVNNLETGKIHQERVRVARDGRVGEIITQLNKTFPGYHIILNNQLSNLQEDDTVEDVCEEGDILTAVRRRQDLPRDSCSEFPSVGDLVCLMNRDKQPILVEPGNEQCWELKTRDFLPTMAVFRKQQLDDDNQLEENREFRGEKYHLPTDREVIKVKITRKNVYSITDEVSTAIPKMSDEVTKFGEIFYKSVGPNLPILFENRGDADVFVLSGGKCSFRSNFLAAGEQIRIKIKSDYRGAVLLLSGPNTTLRQTFFCSVIAHDKPDCRGQHAFGLTPSERVETDQTNRRIFPASVFDLEQGGRKVVIQQIIQQNPAQFRVNIEPGEEQLISSPRQLIRTATKVFRETDNSCLRDALGSFMSFDDEDESLDADDFEYCSLKEEEESTVFLNGALKITRTTFEGPFHFYGRIAQNEKKHADFDKVVDFLEHVESMILLGPLIELELPRKTDVVPEGLKISPAHFLSVPDSERFRNILEGDNHQHHIVKVSQDEDGKLKMTKFGSFTRVTDSFCFGTEDLKNQTLCFLTITGDSGEEKPTCTHGISTTTAVIQKEGKCPHEDGGLISYVLCESKLLDFQKEHKKNIRILDLNTKHYHKLNRESKYKMDIKPGDNSTKFSFLDLCKSNGEHYLGNYPRNIQAKNCKNNLKVCLTLLERDENEWDQKLSTIESIESCQHEEDCKFLNQHKSTRLPDGKFDKTDSKDSNNSSNSPATVVNIHGNVDTVGSIGGKNTKNKAVKDQPREDSPIRRQKQGRRRKR